MQGQSTLDQFIEGYTCVWCGEHFASKHKYYQHIAICPKKPISRILEEMMISLIDTAEKVVLLLDPNNDSIQKQIEKLKISQPYLSDETINKIILSRIKHELSAYFRALALFRALTSNPSYTATINSDPRLQQLYHRAQESLQKVEDTKTKGEQKLREIIASFIHAEELMGPIIEEAEKAISKTKQPQYIT